MVITIPTTGLWLTFFFKKITAASLTKCLFIVHNDRDYIIVAMKYKTNMQIIQIFFLMAEMTIINIKYSFGK